MLHSCASSRPGDRVILVLFLAVFALLFRPGGPASAQIIDPNGDRLVHVSEVERHPPPVLVAKPAGFFDKVDWQALVDETWGRGASAAVQTEFFNTFWNDIDMNFACFPNITDHWYEYRDTYLPEVQAGVSKGRLSGIINHMIMGLREYHTHCWDADVFFTDLSPGVPLVSLWGTGWVGHFGAGLTPLPDKSLLVYKVAPNHPLGLVPGDIVLGYDGVPWHEIYPQLIEAELPIAGAAGCSPKSFEHDWLMSAGMNWHLFDTIDIIRHQTGLAENLPTSLLGGAADRSVWATEQMDVGVLMPDWDADDLVSYGWINRDGDIFGYIYLWAFTGDVDEQFLEAVQAMFDHPETDGLIIDMRFNMGGNMFLSDPALALLFRADVRTVGFARRYDENHYSLEETAPVESFVVDSDPETYWDKPLALLTGPGAISSGDQVALRLKTHPRAHVLGQTTSAAFNSPSTYSLPGFTEWMYTIANSEGFLGVNGNYLTHTELPDIEEVWHTQEAVIAGRDNVVDAAVTWMKSFLYGAEDILVPQQQPTIQAALDSIVPGGVIHVDDGIFTGPGNRDLDPHGKAVTIRSRHGDATRCVIDCEGSEADPHRGFLFRSGETSEVVVQELTIRNAFAAGDGAGALCEGSSPVFRKVMFAGNRSAGAGGGVCFMGGSTAVLDSCSFVENQAASGGGLFSRDSAPILTHCTLYGGEADFGGGMASAGTDAPTAICSILSFAVRGGAVHTDGGAVPTFEACDLFGNEGGDWVGAIAGQLGITGNFSADPLFCSPDGSDLTLNEHSPCLPAAHPERPLECGDRLIGAWPTGCYTEGFIDVTAGDLIENTNTNAAAWADYDLDGDPDLYIVNQWNYNRLLRNDGDGVFVDVTASPISDNGPGRGAAWADFDNDGDPDLYLANYDQPSHLYRNEGDGIFSDVTDFLFGEDLATAVGVSWVDFNNDGLVDLYVIDEGGSNQLFRNLGPVQDDDYFFMPVDDYVISDPGKGSCASWADFNDDGWQDLYLSNDGQNRLIENWGPIGFVDNDSYPLLSMPESPGVCSAWADMNNDGILDLFSAYDQAQDWLIEGPVGSYQVPLPDVGDAGPSRGSAWADFDNDGDQDLYVARYGVTDLMYLNTSLGFIPRPADDFPYNSTAVAWADYDRDGFLDVYIAGFGPNRLLRGIPRQGNHWLHLRLQGVEANASAIGARVRVVTGDGVQIREIAAGSGYLAQDSAEVEFGLGSATMADTVQIWWPGGGYQMQTGIPADQLLKVVESDDWVPVFLTDFSLARQSDGVAVAWTLHRADGDEAFRLEAATEGAARNVSFRMDAPGRFSALDRAASGTGVVQYTLYLQGDDGRWNILASEKLDVSVVPRPTRLRGVHPNPCNPRTTISFEVGRRQRIRLEIFDLMGRRVATVADEFFDPGIHEVSWLGCDDAGRDAASGSYLLRMTAGGRAESRKVVVLR